MKHYLLKFKGNWADEMNLDGYAVLDEVDFKKFERKIKEKFEIDRGFSFYVGTNEYIEYQNIEEIKNDYSLVEIDESEVKVLEKLGIEHMGFAWSFYDFITDCDEEDEDDENETEENENEDE
jgi:hypothetical protein